MPDPITGVHTTGAFNTMLRGRYGAARPATPATQAAPRSDADSADVAKTAALLKSIVETASLIPAVDQARVASLQQAAEAGAVQANPLQIAQSFAKLEALLA